MGRSVSVSGQDEEYVVVEVIVIMVTSTKIMLQLGKFSN